MTEKKLGKIERFVFGYGGYQDAQFGFSIQLLLEAGTGGVGDFIVAQDSAEAVGTILDKAGKQTIDELAGTPVEATFEDVRLKSWRVLTEVL